MLDRVGVGSKLGRYEIVRRLAVGGMAEILLARVRGPAGFEKRVVLKCVLPQFAGDNDFLTMFLDEARLVASLSHPNIAEVNDVGTDGETTYIAMEYVEGADVRTVLKQLRARGEKMPLEHALAIASAICSGLHAAHEKRDADGSSLGIVHRDVSPSNVMVSFEGGVKLVDFGIAKWDTRNSRTRSGLLKGKSAYMSPEQCMGLELDRRSDLFAVGILLYEMVTGTPLFKAENDYAAMCKVVRDEVPPPSALRTMPPALETVILRALAKRAEDRFATADELAIALEQIAHRERIAMSPMALARWMQQIMAGGEAQPTPSPRPGPVLGNGSLPGMPPMLGAAPTPLAPMVQPATVSLRGTPPDGAPRANGLPTMIEHGVPGLGLARPGAYAPTELGLAPRTTPTPPPGSLGSGSGGGAGGVGGLYAVSALDVAPSLAVATSRSASMAQTICERLETVPEAPLVAVTDVPTDLRLKRLGLATGTNRSKLSALDVSPPRRLGPLIGRLMLTAAFGTSLVLAWLQFGDDARRLWRAQAGASEAEDVAAAAAEPGPLPGSVATDVPSAHEVDDDTAVEAEPKPEVRSRIRVGTAGPEPARPDRAAARERRAREERREQERRDRRRKQKEAAKVAKSPGNDISLDDAPAPVESGPGGSIDL